MKRARFAILTCGLVFLLLAVGCVRKEKEEEPEAEKPPKPSAPETVKEVVVTPEIEQKVENLLAPARQRELTDLEKETLLSAFVELGKPGVACLVKELGKQDLNARKVLIEILGKLRDASAVEVLVEQLKQRQEETRLAAVHALGEIGDLKAVPSLITALQRDKKKRVRAEAATSLGLLRAKEAVIPLIQALDPTRERKRWVRRSAAEALGAIGDLQAKEPLMNGLNDKEEVVRIAAMFGLYKLGDTSKLSLLEQRAKDAAAEEEVRHWAIRELGLIGATQSVGVLTEGLNDPSALVRVAAAEALGKTPGVESLDSLIAGLQHRDANVRAAVVESLSARGVPPVGEGDQKLFDALAELIKNEPVEATRKKAKALYDLIRPTLPPQPTSPSPGETDTAPPGGGAPSTEQGNTNPETPTGE